MTNGLIHLIKRLIPSCPRKRKLKLRIRIIKMYIKITNVDNVMEDRDCECRKNSPSFLLYKFSIELEKISVRIGLLACLV